MKYFIVATMFVGVFWMVWSFGNAIALAWKEQRGNRGTPNTTG